MIEKLMITITLTAEFTVIGHNFNEHVMVVVSQMLIGQGLTIMRQFSLMNGM